MSLSSLVARIRGTGPLPAPPPPPPAQQPDELERDALATAELLVAALRAWQFVEESSDTVRRASLRQLVKSKVTQASPGALFFEGW